MPVLGNNIYIGAGAKIIGNIYIADDCVIGANAVVTKSIMEPKSIVAGIPAKVIGKKTKNYCWLIDSYSPTIITRNDIYIIIRFILLFMYSFCLFATTEV